MSRLIQNNLLDCYVNVLESFFPYKQLPISKDKNLSNINFRLKKTIASTYSFFGDLYWAKGC